MKVAVNKRVLFDFLKKQLNENRMPGGDHGGRQVHPFNVQSPNSDPFGYYEDDEATPIKVSDHMAVQLSVLKMPVEDEEFVPGTMTELRDSSILICKEVPVTQIEYFYRQLHMLLDRALDRDDQRNLDLVSESFDISKNTTVKDFNMITESSRILSREDDATGDVEDEASYIAANNKQAYLSGYNAGLKDEPQSVERAQELSKGSADFVSGYMQAMSEDEYEDVDAGLDSEEIRKAAEDERPMFATQPGEERRGEGKPLFRNYQQFLSRGGLEGLKDKSYENASPYERALIDSMTELQTIFREINQEATSEMMNPDLQKEFGALLKPITMEFGLDTFSILTPLNVKRMFSSANRTKNPKKKEEKINKLLLMIFTVVSEATDKIIKKSPRFKRTLKNLATEANIPILEFILKLKEGLAADIANYGASSRFTGDDEVVQSKIDILFASFIKTLKLPDSDNKFKHRKHFHDNVNLDSQEQLLDAFKAVADLKFQDKKDTDLYVFRDADITVGLTKEELMDEIEPYIAAQFAIAEEAQKIIPDSPITTIDVAAEETDEIKEIEAEDYMTALEKFTARQAKGKQVDWQDLAPYFGYSGSAGIIQYFSKDIQPKIQMMSFTDVEGNPSNIGSLMDFNAQMLVDQMLVVINNTLIPKYKKLVATNKIKQQKINNKNKVQAVGTKEILGALEEQILPVLETLQQLFNQGEKYTDIAANRDHTGHELLNLVGGYVFREVNMAPITGVYSTMRGDLNDAIADAIINRVGEGRVSRKAITEKGGIAEYFTGLKTQPDYAAPPASKKGKIVKKLIDIGLTPEVFAEVLVDADETWQDGILDKVQDFDGAIYRDAIEDATDELIENPENLEKAILSAIKATKQEEVYQKMEKESRGE